MNHHFSVGGAQSCLMLLDPMDCSPPGASAHGIFQARILEWGAISYSMGSSDQGMKSTPLASPALAGGFVTTTWESQKIQISCCSVAKLCLTLPPHGL